MEHESKQGFQDNSEKPEDLNLFSITHIIRDKNEFASCSLICMLAMAFAHMQQKNFKFENLKTLQFLMTTDW